jgi:Concanavalin A-like lectin/glucanases superfamily/Carbohydrate binding domain
MPRYIRYYENGEWKYASVKDVGDISKLKTSNKTDLVSAINELIDGGVLQIVEPSLQQQQQQIDSINQTVQNQAVIVANTEQLIQELESIQQQLLSDLEQARVDLEQAKTDLLNKADIDYVDGELVKKVDLTTYQQQYNEITSQLSEKVNLNTYQQEYNQIVSDLSAKSAELQNIANSISGINGQITTINQEIDDINGQITTTINNVNSLENRVTDAESAITQNANEIATKVSRLEYDSAVGKNKWIVSRYDINLGSNTATPSFSHIKGKKPNATVELVDSNRLQAFNSDNHIAHYFTNVYMNTQKTVTLSVTHDDGVAIYMNGAKIYEKGGSQSTPFSVALSFRAGWNTVEILHYNHTGNEYVDLGLTLSSQVDRMTAVIGVGTQYDTRLTQAETQIQQTSDQISLLATKTEVTDLGNRISNAEAQLSIQAGQIASKVSQSDFNAYTDRLTTAESNIEQLQDEIALKVNRTEYDLLNNTVNEHSSQIQLLNESIAIKVDQQVVDGLEQRVTDNEAQISLLEDEILLKANQTDLDQIDGRLTTAEAQIQIHEDEISQTVKKSEMLPMANKVVKVRYIRDWINGSSANTNNHWVEIKAMSGTTNRASGKTPTSNYSLSNGSRITDNDTNSANYAQGTSGVKQYVQIDLGAVYEDIEYIQVWHYYSDGRIYNDTKVEVSEDGVNWTVLFDSSVTGKYKETSNGLVIPVNNNIFNSINNRLQSAETSITQTANAITLKADKSEVYTINQIDNMLNDIDLQISDMNTQIQQTADAITLKADKTEVYTKTETDNLLSNKTDNSAFDALVTRVTDAESAITQNANEIALRVTRTEFDNLKIGGRNLIKNSGNFKTIGNWTTNGSGTSITLTQKDGFSVLEGIKSITGENVTNIKNGTEYVFSAEVMFDRDVNLTSNTPLHCHVAISGDVHGGKETISLISTDTVAKANTWTVISVRFKTKNDVTITHFKPFIYGLADGTKFWVKWWKLEEGNKATAWSPAPEDIDSSISALDSRLTTAETAITQNANQIALKANKSELDTANANISDLQTRMTNAEATLTVQANQIATKVSQSTFDTQMATKANASDVYTKTDIQSSSANNLIHNSEWKTDTTGWTLNTGWTRDPSKTYQGSVTMKVDISGLGSDTWRAIFSEFINVSEGQELVASGYTFSDDISTIDRGASLEIEWYNASNSRISTTSISVKPTSNNTWQRFYVSGVAPTGTVKARIRFHPVRNGRFWVARPMLQYGRIPSAFTPHVDELATNIVTRLSNAESAITQNANEIALRVRQTDFDTYKTANDANVANLQTRMSNAESTITQHSNEIALRVTQTEFNNLKIGGRNLLRNTNFNNGLNNWTNWGSPSVRQVVSVSDIVGFTNALKVTTTGTNQGVNQTISGLVVGETYTLSSWAKSESGQAVIQVNNNGSYLQTVMSSSDAGQNKWVRLTLKFTASSSSITVYIGRSAGGSNGTYYFTGVKLEQGDKATDWSPAPEDIDSKISSLDSRLSTAESAITQHANEISLRVTQQEFNNLKISGRNLILNSTFNTISNGIPANWTGVHSKWTVLAPESDKPNSNILKASATGNGSNQYYSAHSNYFNAKNGDVFTFSVDLKVTDFSAWDVRAPFIVEFMDVNNTRVQYKDVYITDMGVSSLNNNQWYRLSYTATVTNANVVKGRIRLCLFRNGEISIREVKVEQGTRATEWSPAPEDLLRVDDFNAYKNKISDYITKEQSAFATFTRSSTAYQDDGTQVSNNEPRLVTGKFGSGLLIEEGTTNLVPNPLAETDLTGIAKVGTATGTVERNTTPPSGCIFPTAVRANVTASGDFNVTFMAVNGSESTSGISVNPNTTYTISAWVYIPSTSSITSVANRPVEWKSDGSVALDNGTSACNTSVKNQWVRLTRTITTTANTSKITLRFYGAGTGEFYVTGVQLEQKSYATSFMKGTRSSEYLTIPTSGIVQDNKPFTIECWAKSIIDTSPNWRIPFSAWNKFYVAISPNTKKVRISWVDANGAQQYAESSDLNIDFSQWHHWIFTYDGYGKCKLYINRVLAVTANTNLPKPFPASIDVGRLNTNAYYWNGLIDDLRVSSICRTDIEIANYDVNNPLPIDEFTTAHMDFEGDIDYRYKAPASTILDSLENRISTAEQQITADSIISTVTQSIELKNLLDEKANANDLSNYAPVQQVNDLENTVNNINNTLNNIDFSQFVTSTQLDQKADSITAKFSSGGGVNLLRNSVGFAGTDFWTVTGTVNTVQNSELESFGAGSGFVLNGGTISQVIFVTPQTTYTISTIVKKGSTGTGYFKVKDDSQEFTINFNAGTSYIYEKKEIQITPVGSQITVELNGDASSGIIFTSTMANIGDVALQWQHAPDEIYNTNVLMNMNGIKVMSSSYNGYTAITPQEFAGYAEVDGQMQKVFTLNRDVTEMSKASIDYEISMSPIKIIPIKSAGYNGWAFVATE